MFTKQQLAAFNAMNHEQIQKRFKEIQEEVNKNDPNTNLELLQAEFDILSKRDKELKDKVAKRHAFLDTMAKSIEDEEGEFIKYQEEARSMAKPAMPKGLSKYQEKMDNDMEYRSAFMEYFKTGEKAPVLKERENQFGKAANLGVMIPHTVMQKVITELQGVHGRLYSKVRKTNVRGGVEYPIGEFNATFKRITEDAVSDRQESGKITGSIQFKYLIGEIRIARSFLQAILSVEAFEEELAKVIVRAYLKAMDHEILLGNESNNEMQGILTEANKVSGRIKATQIIEFTEEEMADWKTWRTKFFKKIPLAMRSLRPEFVMTAGTFESNIMTLADKNNRPLYQETFNPVNGDLDCRFAGREVTLVEEDGLKTFDDAANGDYFGMYWVPEEAYVINSNLEFGLRKYFDEDKNQEVTKTLVVNDGKPLDTQYIYLLKKKAD